MPYSFISILSVAPVDNATNVPVTTNITVVFDKAMDVDSLNSTTMFLRDASGNSVATTISYDNLTKTATINPDVDLAGSTEYRLTILGGEYGVKTIIGETMFETEYRTFTTEAVSTSPDTGDGGTTDPEPTPTEPTPTLLFEVVDTYPQNNSVHITPEYIKILFTSEVDINTATHDSVYLLPKGKPEELTQIHLLTEFAPSKSILDPTNNPITLEANNKVVSIQLNEGDIQNNTEYTVVVRESLSSIDGTALGESYAFHFYSTLTPFYGDATQVKNDLRQVLRNIPENVLYYYIHDVSVYVDDILSQRGVNIDLTQSIPNYIKQFVRFQVGYDLFLNAYISNADSSGSTRTLGDLTISKESGSSDVTKLLKEFKDRIKPWLDQLHGHTNRGYASPGQVVRGENGDPYPDFFARTEFREL